MVMDAGSWVRVPGPWLRQTKSVLLPCLSLGGPSRLPYGTLVARGVEISSYSIAICLSPVQGAVLAR